MPDTTTQGAIAAAFAKQVAWCNGLAAPFTARVVELLAEDHAAGGTVAQLVGAWPGDPVADALALRLAGALHALVRSGADPALAACYPSHDTSPSGLPQALRAALARHTPFIRAFLSSPPQTNEVGRSAVLLGGFLQVAAATRLPLRLLEIGSSAGLNLLWDRYAYRIAGYGWGDPASPVRLAPEWTGPLPLLDAPVTVADRRGCDVAPIDLSDPGAVLRLRSYVWPDQPARLARIEAAVALAQQAGLAVDRADASGWLARQLQSPSPGRATVVFHSIMWQYMPAATQSALRSTLAQAGAAATPTAPLAWLRFEPPGNEGRAELRLTAWPGAHEHRLATAHPHGTAVAWSGPG